jgi:hypothetical protein
MKKLITVKPLTDHRLELEFEDGVQGVLDMSPYLDFGVFSRLKDPEAFQSVKVSFDTLEWSCGPDLDPEWIRDHIQVDTLHQTG